MHIAYLQPLLDRLGSFQPGFPQVFLVGPLFPIVLALFSRSTILFLGSLLTASIAMAALLQPNSIGVIVATGAYVGSFLVAIFGIQNKRKEFVVRSELTILKAKVGHLRMDEEKSLLANLKKGRNALNNNSDSV